MNQEYIPANESRLITYHVSYAEKQEGYDSDFSIQARNVEHLCSIVTAIFPGRGDFTFSEVQ